MTITITIDDEYLIWSSAHMFICFLTLLLVKKDYKHMDRYEKWVFTILSLIPILNIIIFLFFFIDFYGVSIKNTLKYIYDMPKNANLLQTLKYDNTVLKQENAIFQKMAQLNIDYETAKSLIIYGDGWKLETYKKTVDE